MAKRTQSRRWVPNTTHALLDNLNRQLQELTAGNEVAMAVATLAQQGVVYAARQKWTKSAQVFDQVAQLAMQTGDVAGVAMARYSQGVALFYLPARHTEARQVLQQAVMLAEQVGQSTLAAKGHFILATFYLNAGDTPGAVAALTAAIDQLDAESEPRLAVQLYQARANINLLQIQLDQARTDLEQALTLAKGAGDKGLIFDVQFDQQLLEHYSAGGDGLAPASDEMFKSLQALARKTGAKRLGKFVKLDRAISFLQANEPKKAHRLAQAVRQESLQTTDDPTRYMRYLMACLVVSQAREAMDDRVGVLDVLLVCKRSLEGALGRASGRLVVPFLDALQSRWGARTLQETLQTHQRMQLHGQAMTRERADGLTASTR